MSSKRHDSTTGEKLSDNIFANVEHGQGRFDASIDVRSYAGEDETTEIVVSIGPMEVTIGLSPEQSRELRKSLKENEDGGRR